MGKYTKRAGWPNLATWGSNEWAWFVLVIIGVGSFSYIAYACLVEYPHLLFSAIREIVTPTHWLLLLGVIGALAGIFIFTRSWFWRAFFFIAGLASCFSMIACIIRFQIIGAILFYVLMVFSWRSLDSL